VEFFQKLPNFCIDLMFFLFQLTGDWTQVEIIHLPNEPSVGLGFGIVGGASTGVVIKTILQGSAADKVCASFYGFYFVFRTSG
jgi:hypothetical protein